MIQDLHQVLILLILIHLGLCSYYYLIYQDGAKLREEDKLLNELEERFQDPETLRKSQIEEKKLPSICHGFHDQFSSTINQQLGWRHFWLKNQNNSQIEPDKNFDDIPVRDYLNQLPNVINEITPKALQIR